MTDLIIRKIKGLDGTVKAPSSKAYTHRALIAASLSEGRSLIEEPLICDDTLTTVHACSMVGAQILEDKKCFIVEGVSKPITPEDVIHCKDSGSTSRFMTPVCALADGISVITGNEGLRRRPMKPLLTSLRQLGVQCYSVKADGRLPIIVFGGGIKGGKTFIKGDVSSQYISGLLFGTPKANTNTEITITTQLESKSYVTMTLRVLRDHGIKVECSSDYNHFLVPCTQIYKSSNHVIEGDYSSAAFLLAAASIINSHVKVTNLQKESLQGDRAIVNILRDMRSQVNVGEDFVEIQGVKQGLRGIEIDVRDIPDLAPVCALLGCFAQGETIISGAKRLRFKESDRITSLFNELRKMGGRIKEFKDGLIVNGGKLHGAELDSHNDHRIAMACAVAALGAEGSTIIHGIECVNKSYPKFLLDMVLLGAKFVY
ncbi:3-phosphoshikimate 1-carboxyvinyltransferase [Candidatus Bathyarchaeota archaeon]|nr:3-phosphoshikimate 1-carboxyvinyltransferase [Candidatus Bathyarchaeota archaeon]